MADHGCVTLKIILSMRNFGACYGGVCLGHGYLGAKDFDGTDKAMPYIMRIMDVVGVEHFSELEGKYVRVATKGLGSPVKIIGNIIKDKWFDEESFFADKE